MFAIPATPTDAPHERVINPLVSQINAYPALNIAGKVVSGVLLFAGVAAVTGKLLQMGGVYLITHSPAFEIAGRVVLFVSEKLLLIGKGAFLSIAVPIYTITWIIPKWIATVGIPKGVTLLYKHILRPAYTALQIFSHHLASATKWVWETTIVPLSHQIARLANKLYHAILLPIGKALYHATKWIWHSIIVPIAQALKKLSMRLQLTSCALLAKSSVMLSNGSGIPSSSLLSKFSTRPSRLLLYIFSSLLVNEL